MRFIVILSFIASLNSGFAQDPQLFGNTWYLHNLVINGNNNVPPSNSEVGFVTVAFDVPGFETMVCDVLTADISYNGSNEFTLSNLGATFEDCVMPTNTAFEVLYLDTFYEANSTDPFSYSIVMEGNGSKTLTVTAVTGDQAIYNSELLSTQEFTNSSYIIYPNPVTNSKLVISGLDNSYDAKSSIYGSDGKKILEFDIEAGDSKTIVVDQLPPGAYYMIIVVANGSIELKTVIIGK